MPIELIEAIDSREQSYQRGPLGDMRLGGARFHYRLRGTSNEAIARSMALAYTASSYNGLVRQGLECRAEWVDASGDDGLWLVDVEYALQEATAFVVGDSAISFDTAGGTQHITQARLHLGSWNLAGVMAEAETHKGAINVTRGPEGLAVEGVDLTVPIYHWSETHYLDAALVSLPYRGQLFRLTGTKNAAGFRGCEPGECLFLGASGARRSAEDWEISFRFAASPNRTEILIGGITVPVVKGWDYLWIEYADDATGSRLLQVPIAAHLEEIYEDGDFNLLGIGN